MKFLWGSATSSHQVEGNNTCNDWWQWEAAGRLKEASGDACDHWRLFRDDFKLAKALRHNAHRLSIEWSRIEPEEGKFDAEAIGHYQEVIASLKELDIEPLVTLWHFTLPKWLAAEGGWLCPRAPRVFARYAAEMAKALGPDVRLWITLNEPEVYIYKAYVGGDWPPGEKNQFRGIRVYLKLLAGHLAAYYAIKKVLGDAARIGLAKGVVAFTPCRKENLLDRLAAATRDFFFNHYFIRASKMGGLLRPGRGALDFIGLNYYSRNLIRFKSFGFPGIFGTICNNAHHPETSHVNALGWEIYPEGLYLLLKAFSRYHLPIMVTENGICTNDDNERSRFIDVHVAAMKHAMSEGAPVFGYLYWSLLDNYEWADGYAPRFGLVEVDYATQKRSPRPSAMRFAEICQSGI